MFARTHEDGIDTVTFADLARSGPKRAGVGVTFDDMDIDAWFGWRDIFARHDARATFLSRGIANGPAPKARS